jgi:hypothetical protein
MTAVRSGVRKTFPPAQKFLDTSANEKESRMLFASIDVGFVLGNNVQAI